MARARATRSIVRCPTCKTNNLVLSADAIRLRQVIDTWFRGSRNAAARHFKISRVTLWFYTSGSKPVSRPVLAKMEELKRQQKRRRNRERLEIAEREAAIILALGE